LWYIFANNFNKLQNIFSDFVNGQFPFLISNWFPSWILPRPIFFWENEKEESNLKKDISKEINRKNLKKVTHIPTNREILELSFKNKNIEKQNKYNELLNQYFFKGKEKTQNIIRSKVVSDYKNSIPRFHSDDTSPFAISNITYSNQEFLIYVKIFDETKFQEFFETMKNTFETIWRWAKKSIWYGKVKKFELKKLDNNEKEVFDLIEQKRDEWIYYILNNYKPTKKEILNFDLKHSFLSFNIKHWKIFPKNWNWQKQPFKWQFSFIAAWSTIKVNPNDQQLKWCKYKFKWENCQIFNFWYIF